jgi:hypothetical protein
MRVGQEAVSYLLFVTLSLKYSANIQIGMTGNFCYSRVFVTLSSLPDVAGSRKVLEPPDSRLSGARTGTL